jgi:hypothetical protein
VPDCDRATTGQPTCKASGCRKVATSWPWSPYCSTHAARKYRTGSVHGKAVSDTELKPYRLAAEKMLAKYSRSAAVRTALEIAAGYVTFTTRNELVSGQRELEARMATMRELGVTPQEVLAACCAVWGRNRERPFETPKELEQAIASAVFRLRLMGKWRPPSTLSRWFGREVIADLGQFLAGIWLRIDKDAATRRDAKQAFANGWTLDGEQPGPDDGCMA